MFPLIPPSSLKALSHDTTEPWARLKESDHSNHKFLVLVTIVHPGASMQKKAKKKKKELCTVYKDCKYFLQR